MKNLLKMAALIVITSGLAACSSAKKEEDNVMADLADADTSIEQTEETPENTDLIEPEEDTSLGMGSSGLGH